MYRECVTDLQRSISNHAAHVVHVCDEGNQIRIWIGTGLTVRCRAGIHMENTRYRLEGDIVQIRWELYIPRICSARRRMYWMI